MARQTVEITQCDRCGRKKCEGSDWLTIYYQIPEDSSTPPDFDLCWHCSKEFALFMKTGKKE